MMALSAMAFKALREQGKTAAGLLGLTLLINISALASWLLVVLSLGVYVETGFDDTLVTLSLGMLLALLLRVFLLNLRDKIAGGLDIVPGVGLWESLYASSIQMSAQAMKRLPASLRMETMEHVRTLQNAGSRSTITSMLDAPFILVFLCVAMLISPVLGLLGLFFCLPALCMGLLAPLMGRKHAEGLKKASAAGAKYMVAACRGTDSVQAGGAYSHVQGELKALFSGMSRMESRATALSERFSSLTIINGVASRVIVYAVGAKLCVLGELGLAELIGVSLLVSRAVGQTSAFSTALYAVRRARKAQRALAGFFKLPKDSGGRARPKNCKGRLEFHDLAFRYQGSTTPLFESLNAELRPGGMMLVHGPNGSGKSTLVRMMTGILMPGRGSILIDGANLHHMHPDSLGKRFFYLPQEPGFLRGSIAENLTAAAPGCKSENLQRITARLGLDPFLRTLHEGLATQILDGGYCLPPGIRKKFALARSLLHYETHRPPFAFFDAPLEGMDTAGKKLIFTLLRDLTAAGSSVVVFTHDVKSFQGAHVRIDLGVKPKPHVMDLGLAGQGAMGSRLPVQKRA
jgi:ATP-binding cassette subfamily C protein LapB